MRAKYKKLLLLLLVFIPLLTLGVAAQSGVVTADPSGSGCFADNSDLCSTQACHVDSRGNAVGGTDCYSADPATQSGSQCTGANGKSGGGSCDLVGKYINPAIKLLTILVGVVATISIIFGGIQYSTSAGDPAKVSAAKGRLTKTIIALVCYAFLYGFLQFLVPGGLFNR